MATENRFERDHGLPETRTFESRVENAEEIGDLVIEKLKARGWSDEKIGNFGVAVIEAAANAIVHGNREMPEKKVTVEMNLDDERAVVIVKDEGDGFDPGLVPDPTAQDHVLETHGRGVFLLHELCDEFEYRDGGRTAMLTKYKRKPAKDSGPRRAGQ